MVSHQKWDAKKVKYSKQTGQNRTKHITAKQQLFSFIFCAHKRNKKNEEKGKPESLFLSFFVISNFASHIRAFAFSDSFIRLKV